MLLQLSKMLRSMLSGVKVHDVLLKVAHACLTLKYTVVAVQLLTCVLLFATPQTAECQASLSMGFSRQEYWSGLPRPPPGDLSNLGLKPRPPTLQADFLPSEPPGESIECLTL